MADERENQDRLTEIARLLERQGFRCAAADLNDIRTHFDILQAMAAKIEPAAASPDFRTSPSEGRRP